MAAESLAALAVRHGSDKGPDFDGVPGHGHGYTRVYEALLAGREREPLRILEIGLLHPHTRQAVGGDAFDRCPSLEMWADYLPNARVYGLDLLDFSRFRRGGVVVRRADQGDRTTLREAIGLFGGQFDLVIDDGSHASHHQQITLGALFPFVRPGGWYVIEDLYYQPPELEPAGIAKTVELLRAIEQGRDPGAVPGACTSEELAFVRQETEEVMLFDSLAPWEPLRARDALGVLRRRAARGGPAPMDEHRRVGAISDLIHRLAGRPHSWAADRPLWVWGTGPEARRLLRLLTDAGAGVRGMIDPAAPEGVAVALPAHGSGAPFVIVAAPETAEIGWQPGAIGFDFVAVETAAIMRLEADMGQVTK